MAAPDIMGLAMSNKEMLIGIASTAVTAFAAFKFIQHGMKHAVSYDDMPLNAEEKQQIKDFEKFAKRRDQHLKIA